MKNKDDAIVCMVCGGKFNHLPSHIIHSVYHPSWKEYKEKYGNNHDRYVSGYLYDSLTSNFKGKQHSKESKRKMSEKKKKYYKDNPDVMKGANNPLYGVGHTEESRKKMSKSQKKRFSKPEDNPRYGVHLTDETKRKISEANKGRKRTDEFGQKVSERMSGENHHMYGKHHSEETKRKISEANSGVNAPMYGRKPQYPKPYFVEDLDHLVRSSWEEEIGMMLKDNGIEYEYESDMFEVTYDGTKHHYHPDFIISNGNKKVVVEPHCYFNDISLEKFNSFNLKYPDILFVVLSGSKPDDEICDVFINWENRHELIDVIRSVN